MGCKVIESMIKEIDAMLADGLKDKTLKDLYELEQHAQHAFRELANKEDWDASVSFLAASFTCFHRFLLVEIGKRGGKYREETDSEAKARNHRNN